MARSPFQAKRPVGDIIDLLKRCKIKNTTRSVSTSDQGTSSAATIPTSTFTLFFELPAELRETVYEYYFAGTRIGVGSHPRDGHGTALLFVSKQVHEEALPVMYRCGRLTIDLSPQYWKTPPTYDRYLDGIRGDSLYLFRGRPAPLWNFSHVHFTVAEPAPPCSHRRPLQALVNPSSEVSTWWQQVAVIFDLAPRHPGICDPRATAAINLGDITSLPATPGEETFASYATRPWGHTEGWRYAERQARERGKLTLEERKSLRRGAFFLRHSPQTREVIAKQTIFNWLGQAADSMGTRLRIVSAGQTEESVVTSDKLPDLVESAQGLVAGKENKDVWIVLEPGVKADDDEADKDEDAATDERDEADEETGGSG